MEPSSPTAMDVCSPTLSVVWIDVGDSQETDRFSGTHSFEEEFSVMADHSREYALPVE